MQKRDEAHILTKIHITLCGLGLMPADPKMFYTAYAVLLVYYEPKRLNNTEKFLYSEVARHYQTNAKTVECSIRRSIHLLWHANAEGLSDFIGNTSRTMPRPEDFIAALAASL